MVVIDIVGVKVNLTAKTLIFLLETPHNGLDWIGSDDSISPQGPHAATSRPELKRVRELRGEG